MSCWERAEEARKSPLEGLASGERKRAIGLALSEEFIVKVKKVDRDVKNKNKGEDKENNLTIVSRITS